MPGEEQIVDVRRTVYDATTFWFTKNPRMALQFNEATGKTKTKNGKKYVQWVIYVGVGSPRYYWHKVSK